MKSHKRTLKTPTKDLVFKSFMKAPIPMCISTAKDGIYVEANESILKYMGLKHKDMIGHKSTELGHWPVGQRHIFIDAIREQGFVRNILLEVHIENQGVLQMLFGMYPFKKGKEEFFFCYAHDISNHQPSMKKFQDDKFYKITFVDDKYIKGKLKPYHLTPRQQEVAILLAKGLSNKEIAENLFICENTVKDHIKEIFHIIGVHNRSELFPKLINLR